MLPPTKFAEVDVVQLGLIEFETMHSMSSESGTSDVPYMHKRVYKIEAQSHKGPSLKFFTLDKGGGTRGVQRVQHHVVVTKKNPRALEELICHRIPKESSLAWDVRSVSVDYPKVSIKVIIFDPRYLLSF